MHQILPPELHRCAYWEPLDLTAGAQADFQEMHGLGASMVQVACVECGQIVVNDARNIE